MYLDFGLIGAQTNKNNKLLYWAEILEHNLTEVNIEMLDILAKHYN